ncbi:MAG: 5-(carboxyamino)imidazole ribonucleotide synthase [Cyclobacteriaceae bacterium]
MKSQFDQNLRLGILGGGQLGRMLLQSGVDFNLNMSFMDPDPAAPCSQLGNFRVGSLTNYEDVLKFGEGCDLLTIEIENVNTQALKQLERLGKNVYPQPHIIELIQDKREQKKFYQDRNIPTAHFILTENRKEVQAQSEFLPAVNKLAKEGYDGRGVQILRTAGDLDKAFEAPSLLEKLIDFEREIAIIVARNTKGEITSYPAVEMAFHPEKNLVEYLFAPAEISESISKKADEIAKRVVQELEMIGLLAVEMFVTKEGDVLVNEIAPRPHNSGHQTIEASETSQYEQHLRAIMGWPLGSTRVKSLSAMVNLLGEDGFAGEAKYQGFNEVLAVEGAHIHLYGKKLTKPFRKMGHVTIVDQDMESLKKKANFVKHHLKVIA